VEHPRGTALEQLCKTIFLSATIAITSVAAFPSILYSTTESKSFAIPSARPITPWRKSKPLQRRPGQTRNSSRYARAANRLRVQNAQPMTPP